MVPSDSVRARLPWLLAAVVGLFHAAAFAAVVARLDYPVDALAYALGGRAGALAGLFLLGAVPALLALRHRLVVPLTGVLTGAGWTVAREFTTPRPEFSELGGHTVINGMLYVDGYVDGWYVWLFAAVLAGLAEFVVRSEADWLPSPGADDAFDCLLDTEREAAFRTATVVGAAHVVVFLTYAADWGYFGQNGFFPSPWYLGLATFGWTVLGLFALGAIPVYLLVSHRIVAPTVAFAWLVTRIGWDQQRALPDDSLPIYFLGWFFFAGVLLVVAAAEYGFRRAGRWTDRLRATG